MQGAKVIEAEVVAPTNKPEAASGKPKANESKEGQPPESKPGDADPGFRPFQRLRRFFSPAGK